MSEPPTQNVLDMQKRGINDSEIISRLRQQGFTEREINDAFNQAKVKSTLESSDSMAANIEGMSPSIFETTEEENISQELEATQGQSTYQRRSMQQPQPPSQSARYYYPQQQEQMEYEYPEGYQEQENDVYTYPTEAIEEIVESVIQERWREFREEVGDVRLWRETFARDLERLERRIDRLDDAINKIQASLLDKVQEYGRGIRSLGADMKAVEAGLANILDPLRDNVKELGRVVSGVKERSNVIRSSTPFTTSKPSTLSTTAAKKTKDIRKLKKLP